MKTVMAAADTRDGHTTTRLVHRRDHHPGGGGKGPPGPCPGGGGPSGPPGAGGGPPNGPPGGGGPGCPGGGGGGGGSALATPAPMPATAAPKAPASNEPAMSCLNFTRPIHPSSRRFLTWRREIILLAPLVTTVGGQPEVDLKTEGQSARARQGGDDGAVIAVRRHLSSHGRTNSATENLARAAHPALGM
ncbi:hypothetical protein MMARJ_14080 [Mycobacterium marseillense]|uniref:Uncharacterized protein n=1 Tax=Mycobacterium marseillense TaxID=701042 RepID=A0ABM7J9Y6_9MYCO|nr:hypothetical protein MMARJ_14080 [Mycobacterium marseillense]